MNSLAEASLDELREQVLAARASGLRLRIHGGGSKHALCATAADAAATPAEDAAARDDGRRTLVTTAHHGVVAYEPSELVFTARAGTSLADAQALLAEHGQALPFEPPSFGPGATLGGMVACGWSGPARPWRGAVRDALLGVQMINGLGEVLRFGGQVMKNVAGYDLARLQAGAFGRLGVLTEVSLKVLPRPACSRTQMLELARDAALTRVVALQRGPEPITGSLHVDGRLYLRFAGNAAAVNAAADRCGGTCMDEAEAGVLWADVREHRLPFFASGAGELWRLSLPHAAAYPGLVGEWCTEWAGAQRWLRTRSDAGIAPASVFTAAAAAGGHAERWQPARLQAAASTVRGELERRLAAAFDPDGVFAAQ